MQWPIALMVLGNILAAGGMVYAALDVHNTLRARRTLVAQLAKDREFVTVLQRPEVGQLLGHEISRSERELAASVIERLHALMVAQLRLLNPLENRLMAEGLRQDSTIGRARFVMSIAQLVERHLLKNGVRSAGPDPGAADAAS